MSQMNQPLVVICRDVDFEDNKTEMEMFLKARVCKKHIQCHIYHLIENTYN